MTSVENLLPVQNALGEGPLWHVDEGVFYWVDINGEAYYRWKPGVGEPEKFDVGQPVGCIAFREQGGLLLGLRDGLAKWEAGAETYTMLQDNVAYQPVGRFNDGAVDRQGRFWAGTMTSEPISKLYRLDADGSLHVMEEGIKTSNGLGWSPDSTVMYYIDSGLRTLFAYDFDAATGAIANRKVLYKSDVEGVTPDGCTVDSEGYIWVAFWNGWKVARFAPDGTIDREIKMPAQRVTSCCFGGDNLDELYITTARTGLSEDELAQQPDAGNVFRVKLDVRGLPEPLAKF